MGEISVDFVTLSVQEKQYCDQTVHYIEIRSVHNFKAPPNIKMVSRTILLKRKRDNSNGEGIRSLLDVVMRSTYGSSLEDLTACFTVFTVYAAVMAKVAGSYVSS